MWNFGTNFEKTEIFVNKQSYEAQYKKIKKRNYWQLILWEKWFECQKKIKNTSETCKKIFK